MYAEKRCVITISKREKEGIRDIMGILLDKDYTGYDLSSSDIVSVLSAIGHEDNIVIDESGEEIRGLEIEYDD